jgi:hypothetical protein
MRLDAATACDDAVTLGMHQTAASDNAFPAFPAGGADLN